MNLSSASSKQGIIGVTGLYRPVRWAGLGISVVAPFTQNSEGKFSFSKESGSGRYDLYNTSTYAHTIDRSYSITGIGRFFIETKANFFVDARLTWTKLSETLLAKRPYAPPETSGSVYYSALPELYLDYSNEVTALVPGISVGIMPHLSDKLFLSASVTCDVFLFNDPGYSYWVEVEPVYGENAHVMRLLESPLQGTVFNFTVTGGLGTYF